MTKEDLILQKLHDLSSDIKEIRSEQKVLNEKLIRFDCCLNSIVEKNKESKGWIEHTKKSFMAIPFSAITAVLISLLVAFFK